MTPSIREWSLILLTSALFRLGCSATTLCRDGPLHLELQPDIAVVTIEGGNNDTVFVRSTVMDVSVKCSAPHSVQLTLGDKQLWMGHGDVTGHLSKGYMNDSAVLNCWGASHHSDTFLCSVRLVPYSSDADDSFDGESAEAEYRRNVAFVVKVTSAGLIMVGILLIVVTLYLTRCCSHWRRGSQKPNSNNRSNIVYKQVKQWQPCTQILQPAEKIPKSPI